MTREEAIKGLYTLKECLVENPIELEGHKSLPITLIDYAIESLEQDPVLDKIRAEITTLQNRCYALTQGTMCAFCKYECKYKAETE